MKKGQAAMEFLMTYGWAILVVLAAIGALAYFGVLSPGNLLPERTVYKAPLPSVDNAIVYDNGTVQIPFRNNKGETIRLDGVFSGDQDCAVADSNSISASFTNTTSITMGTTSIGNGEAFTITFECGALTKSAGDKFKSSIAFDYTTVSTGLSRPHSGSIDAEILAQ